MDKKGDGGIRWNEIPDLDALKKKAKKHQPEGRSYKDEIILLDFSCFRKQLNASSKKVGSEEE